MEIVTVNGRKERHDRHSDDTHDTHPTRDSLAAQRDGRTPDEAEQGVGAPACSSAEKIRRYLMGGVMISIPRRR